MLHAIWEALKLVGLCIVAVVLFFGAMALVHGSYRND